MSKKEIKIFLISFFFIHSQKKLFCIGFFLYAMLVCKTFIEHLVFVEIDHDYNKRHRSQSKLRTSHSSTT